MGVDHQRTFEWTVGEIETIRPSIDLERGAGTQGSLHDLVDVHVERFSMPEHAADRKEYVDVGICFGRISRVVRKLDSLHTELLSVDG